MPGTHIFLKNAENKVFVYAADGSDDEYISSDLIPITEEEARVLCVPADPRTVDLLKSTVTSLRWKLETGGISLSSGIRVATAIDDQNRITSVVANAERSGLSEFDFKAKTGWVRVTLAELQDIAAAVAQHVQACFSAERTHHEAIDALAGQYKADSASLQAALDVYNELQGWPNTHQGQEAHSVAA